MKARWFIGFALVLVAACSSASSTTDNGGVQGNDTVATGDTATTDTATGDAAPTDTAATEGTTGDTATTLKGCAALQACCDTLSDAAGMKSDCLTILQACNGNDLACTNQLNAEQAAGFCK